MPLELPVKIPVEAMVAYTLLLVQVPPVTVSPKVMVCPSQTEVLPVMAVGVCFTVHKIGEKQPAGNKYLIVVVSETRPVTTPEEVTEATVGLLLTQIPPVVMSYKFEFSPTHTEAMPVTAAAEGFTVIIFFT